MKLTLETYRDKLRGCWLGKTIGGTLGAPFEGRRAVYDLTYYAQDVGAGAPPNDDLDLQLVWLNAVETFGRNVNAAILGEYWLSFITPHWGEYGAGKNNLRMGIVPPLSGMVNNEFRNSNGAFIRSEIWACLAPGHPDIAVRYAYEDAIVDHTHEGLYAELFFAAVQSSAFAEQDTDRLIDIGLSYIPHDCGVAQGVREAVAAFEGGDSWQQARIRVLTAVPGSFGYYGTPPERMPEHIPIGPMGWDAPSNVGIAIIGWLYGKGDFARSLCIAANCGEDTDCTAATLGATLGIMLGEAALPPTWKQPIGDQIHTWCLNLGDQGIAVPKTITELTERIVKVTPLFLGGDICDYIHSRSGYTIETKDGRELAASPRVINCWSARDIKDLARQSPFTAQYDFPIFTVYVDYAEEPFIQDGVAKTFRVTVENRIYAQQWLLMKWHVPDGWVVSPAGRSGHSLEQYHCNVGKTEATFRITPGGLAEPRYDVILEIASAGRPTKGLISVVLIRGA